MIRIVFLYGHAAGIYPNSHQNHPYNAFHQLCPITLNFLLFSPHFNLYFTINKQSLSTDNQSSIFPCIHHIICPTLYSLPLFGEVIDPISDNLFSIRFRSSVPTVDKRSNGIPYNAKIRFFL